MDTRATDLLQINETDHVTKDESKLTKMRSLIDNMQLQIQLGKLGLNISDPLQL